MCMWEFCSVCQSQNPTTPRFLKTNTHSANTNSAIIVSLFHPLLHCCIVALLHCCIVATQSGRLELQYCFPFHRNLWLFPKLVRMTNQNERLIRNQFKKGSLSEFCTNFRWHHAIEGLWRDCGNVTYIIGGNDSMLPPSINTEKKKGINIFCIRHDENKISDGRH